jgi:hypothetical protein
LRAWGVWISNGGGGGLHLKFSWGVAWENKKKWQKLGALVISRGGGNPKAVRGHPGWKVCIMQPRYRACNFDAFY